MVVGRVSNLEALVGSNASRERVKPMHRNMIGSVSDDRLCADCTAPLATISTRQARDAERRK